MQKGSFYKCSDPEIIFAFFFQNERVYTYRASKSDTNLFAKIVIEVVKGKWSGFVEIDGLPYDEYKEVSFSSESGWVSGSDAVYRILDGILSTKKVVYDTSFL